MLICFGLTIWIKASVNSGAWSLWSLLLLLFCYHQELPGSVVATYHNPVREMIFYYEYVINI